MDRDLKVDLERLNQAMQNSLANWYDFLVANGERWLNEALAEKERADKYKALVQELVKLLERIKYLSEEGFMIDETDDYALEQMINKAKEVLGDG